jgi:hypothetical protein
LTPLFCFVIHCVFWTWNCRWVYFDLCAQFHLCDFASVGCQLGCHLCYVRRVNVGHLPWLALIFLQNLYTHAWFGIFQKHIYIYPIDTFLKILWPRLRIQVTTCNAHSSSKFSENMAY